MELVFVCPETGRVFRTSEYEIIDNRGVVEDEQGNRVLDARVRPQKECPFCGEYHVFRADELSCPFDA